MLLLYWRFSNELVKLMLKNFGLDISKGMLDVGINKINHKN